MGNIGAAISRNRQQSETKNVYSPDLEYAGQGYADALYGRGSPYGGVGMSGGQYPTANKDPAGFGTGTYGYPGQYGNGPGGQPGAGNIYPGGGAYGGGGKSAYGQPGTAGSDMAGGGQGGYQFGGGGGQGYGGYAAMQPYQFGSGGATGDVTAAGGAAYGGYGDVSQGYGRLGQAYGRMGSQGVTGQERANLMAASNEAIQSNVGANRDIINNRVAQSGNTAGSYGALARLGAAGGQQLEAADRANQTAIMAENQRRKEAGLAGQGQALQGRLGAAGGQAGLYGTGTSYAANLMGGRAGLAKLKQRDYTQGAGTGGTVSYSSGQMG